MPWENRYHPACGIMPPCQAHDVCGRLMPASNAGMPALCVCFHRDARPLLVPQKKNRCQNSLTGRTAPTTTSCARGVGAQVGVIQRLRGSHVDMRSRHQAGAVRWLFARAWRSDWRRYYGTGEAHELLRAGWANCSPPRSCTTGPCHLSVAAVSGLPSLLEGLVDEQRTSTFSCWATGGLRAIRHTSNSRCIGPLFTLSRTRQ
jgi:hypothetical protein